MEVHPLAPSLDLTTSSTEPLVRENGHLPDLLSTMRRHIHAHPELGFEEYQTSAYIREVLEMHGLHGSAPMAVTGFFVDIEGALPGPFVGYRADMDALPIQDLKECPYKSTRPGLGHLCGHDAHIAMAVGVAIELSRMRERLHGRCRVFFQPSEERTPSGAVRLIEEGILTDLEAVYAVHVDPTLPAGRFGVRAGAMTAAADRFHIDVIGPGTAHAARPHETVDTIWVATAIANALYTLIGRLTDARNPAVLTICRMHGGDAYNVVPDHVELGGTLRTTDAHDRRLIKNRIESLATDIGRSMGARVAVDLSGGAPAVENDPTLSRLVEGRIVALFGQDAFFHVPRPSMGSEDFAHYLQHVPGALVRVGTGSDEATSYRLHDSRFDLDESALAPAARLMAAVIAEHTRTTPLAGR